MSASACKPIVTQIEDTNTKLFDEIRCLVAHHDQHVKWLDNMAVKVRAELGDRASAIFSDSTNERPSLQVRQSDSSRSPVRKPSAKLYQASVEDADGSSSEHSVIAEPTKEPLPKSTPDQSRGQSRHKRLTTSDLKDNARSSSSKLHPAYDPPGKLLAGSKLSPAPLPSPPPSITPPRPSVHFTERRPVVLHNHSSPCSQTTKVKINEPVHMREERSPSSPAVSTWGKLFNEKGEPTQRMGDVLRGLAKYLITEYPRKQSLVVTPEKLLRFYTKYGLPSEVFPFERLFEKTSRTSYHLLERVYVDLRCEYYLVPDQSRGDSLRPIVPSLTPKGFVQWMCTLISAFPDLESRRLGLVVADVALEAVEEIPSLSSEKPEELPRKLPRDLIPPERDEKIYDVVLRSLEYWRKEITAERPASRTSDTDRNRQIKSTASTYPPLQAREEIAKDASATKTRSVRLENEKQYLKSAQRRRDVSPMPPPRSRVGSRILGDKIIVADPRQRRRLSPKPDRRIPLDDRSRPPLSEERSRDQEGRKRNRECINHRSRREGTRQKP